MVPFSRDPNVAADFVRRALAARDLWHVWSSQFAKTLGPSEREVRAMMKEIGGLRNHRENGGKPLGWY